MGIDLSILNDIYEHDKNGRGFIMDIHESNKISNRIYEMESRKEKRFYFLKQKLTGLIMLLIGIVIPLTCDGDATFSLIAFPIGIHCLVTKEKIMNN